MKRIFALVMFVGLSGCVIAPPVYRTQSTLGQWVDARVEEYLHGFRQLAESSGGRVVLEQRFFKRMDNLGSGVEHRNHALEECRMKPDRLEMIECMSFNLDQISKGLLEFSAGLEFSGRELYGAFNFSQRRVIQAYAKKYNDLHNDTLDILRLKYGLVPDALR